MKTASVKLFSTFFYVGRLKPGPGTLASAVGLGLWCLLHQSLLIYIILWAVITWLGFLVSGPMEEIEKEKDPGCVVIDEVSGMMIGAFLLPLEWPVLITAFFLFRAFDMFKLYPVNLFEEMGGGVGIMMDDVAAGVYTFITMQIAIRLAGII